MGCFLCREPDSVCQAYMCTPNVFYLVYVLWSTLLWILLALVLLIQSPLEAYLITPFCLWFSLGRSFGSMITSTVAHTLGWVNCAAREGRAWSLWFINSAHIVVSTAYSNGLPAIIVSVSHGQPWQELVSYYLEGTNDYDCSIVSLAYFWSEFSKVRLRKQVSSIYKNFV
jgi:hypothetical protein